MQNDGQAYNDKQARIPGRGARMTASDDETGSAADRVAALLARLRAGDDTAIELIFDAAFQDRQFRACGRRVNRQYLDEGWDAACWSAVKFLRAHPDRQFPKFDAWFHKILLREARRCAVADTAWSSRTEPLEPDSEIAGTEDGAYEGIVDQLQLRHLTDRIARELPRPAERRAFETHIRTGFRNEELAQVLDVAPGAARVALHRALKSARPITTRVLTTARLAAQGTSGCTVLASLVGGRELPLPDDVWDSVRRHTDSCPQCQRTSAVWGEPSPLEQTRILQKVADNGLSTGGSVATPSVAPLGPQAAVSSSLPARALPRVVARVVRKKTVTLAVTGAAVASTAVAMMLLPGGLRAQATTQAPVVAGTPTQQPASTLSPSPQTPHPVSTASTQATPSAGTTAPQGQGAAPTVGTQPAFPTGQPTPTNTPKTSHPHPHTGGGPTGGTSGPVTTTSPSLPSPSLTPTTAPVAPDLSGGMSLLFTHMSWLAGTPERSWAITLTRGTPSQCPTSDPCYLPADGYWVSAPGGEHWTSYFVLTIVRTAHGWAVHGTDGDGLAGKTDQHYDGVDKGNLTFAGTFVELSTGHTADMVLTSCVTTPAAPACDLLPG